MSAEIPTTPTNVLIMNPYFSVKDGKLDVRLHEQSFSNAMDFVAKNSERVRHIFMMVDVPPRTSRAHGIFRTKADARNRKGEFGLRHLGQFHLDIINWYRPLLQEKTPEEIFVLTESKVRVLLQNLPLEYYRKLPQCESDGSACWIDKVSCRAITAVGMNFCLIAWDVNQLEIFIQEEVKRTEFDTMANGAMDVSRIFWHERAQLNLKFCE